jgi:membrane carboxypeptidase/penicillin-binding protein PbpC
MYLKTCAFAIINGSVNATPEDMVEAYQFVSDNGYFEELTPQQLLTLRELVETNKVFTPTLVVNLS